MYTESRLIFIRAITPVHVGVGRVEKSYVDLPVQRDEFGFPTIWASSLKGAIKANITDNVRKYLGSEPEEPHTKPSAVSILDARLLFMPVRVLNGIWCYATTPLLLEMFNNYLGVISQRKKVKLNVDFVSSISEGVEVISTRSDLIENGKIIVNETVLNAKVQSDLMDKLGFRNAGIPSEILDTINRRGLVVITDKDNISLSVLNKSMLIQYRVRLSREQKTVEEGPWSEEYVPIETIFVSLILCRDSDGKSASNICEELANNIDNKVIYIGGRETIGRGLVKMYVVKLE